MSDITLAKATANTNSRIHKLNLSAFETWTQRDKVSGEQLPINKRQLVIQQLMTREQNHGPSAKSKAYGKPPALSYSFNIGDLVHL